MYYRFLAIFSHCFSGLCRVAVCFAHSSGFPSKPMICTMSSFSNSSSMAPSNPVPDCRPIMATANVRRPSISAIQPMVSCRWYRTTDTPGDVQVSIQSGKVYHPAGISAGRRKKIAKILFALFEHWLCEPSLKHPCHHHIQTEG